MGVIPVMVETRFTLRGTSMVLALKLIFCFSRIPYSFALTFVGRAFILGWEEPVRLDIESIERAMCMG
jgi:hypothetical protein